MPVKEVGKNLSILEQHGHHIGRHYSAGTAYHLPVARKLEQVEQCSVCKCIILHFLHKHLQSSRHIIYGNAHHEAKESRLYIVGEQTLEDATVQVIQENDHCFHKAKPTDITE